MVDPLVGSRSSLLVRDLGQMRDSLSDLQRQLSTGKTADTYAGLGPERSLSIAFRSDVSRLDSYQSSITMVELRLSISDQVMTRMNDVATEARGAMDPNIYDLLSDGRTQGQATARNLLGETLSLLNSEAGGRHLFAGEDVLNKPVESLNAIMEGEGARVGFTQHKAERFLADSGSSGTGRLDVTQPLTNQVQMSEDGSHPFGMKISALNNGLSNTTSTGPTGDPATIGIDFAGQPTAGETIKLSFDLPDGSVTDIVLTAAVAGQGGDGLFEIGATPDDTAANLSTALTSALQYVTDVELQAASAISAGEDFFNTANGAVPQRVDGPPFESAIALRDGTPEDTVFWYKGDNAANSARKTATARIDDGLSISYGARANEEAFQVLVQNLAVFSSDTFVDGNENDEARYGELASKTVQNISYPSGVQKLEQIAGELGAARSAAGNADARHTVKGGTLQTMIDGIETADLNEVSVNILTLQTQMEASYRATSILFDMSLVNYI
ncbi:MAG: flagellin [Hyphomicrobiales bacterium]